MRAGRSGDAGIIAAAVPGAGDVGGYRRRCGEGRSAGGSPCPVARRTARRARGVGCSWWTRERGSRSIFLTFRGVGGSDCCGVTPWMVATFASQPATPASDRPTPASRAIWRSVARRHGGILSASMAAARTPWLPSSTITMLRNEATCRWRGGRCGLCGSRTEAVRSGGIRSSSSLGSVHPDDTTSGRSTLSARCGRGRRGCSSLGPDARHSTRRGVWRVSGPPLLGNPSD
jgi:hypothetical protein